MLDTAHLHPMMVHFPIALILLGMLGEVAAMIYKNEEWLKKASFYVMVIGALSALAALGTGYLFTEEPLEGALAEAIEIHETMALIATIIVCVSVLFRTYLTFKENVAKWMNLASFALFAIAALAISITGYLGGTVVYDYMTGL